MVIANLRALALALWLLGLSLTATAAEPGNLRVLFLGDEGHHQPRARAIQIAPVLQRAGIEVQYSSDLSQLTLSNLKTFDALLVYANIDDLDDAPAQAILQYVEQGGGYCPIHCASFCFRNQPKLVELCGAQFSKHGTGDFATRVRDEQHPIMKGLMPFTTWDETYEHIKHNDKDRAVLQTRDDNGRSEPWTWTRKQGQGRVFYTAYGHDHRTWENPGFHALMERGIRWAAGQDVISDSIAQPAAKPVQFEFATDDGKGLPDYRHSQGSGNTINKIQKPLEPAQAAERVSLPRGFQAEIFVSEPNIGKPLCVAWDERGRLWVAETVDYPNDLQPKAKGRDRIKICEDTDGDHRADKFTVFAEGLSIPTGMAFANGGLVVHLAPDTVFFKDVDGDDKCDETKVLFTGWGTFDTHAGPSNLRYGPDNWLYTMVGYSGFRGTVGGERHQFGQGIVRFKSDGSKLEFVRSTNNNSWGLGFSEDGLLFGSTANGCPSVYAPLANRHYESVRGWSSSVLENIAPGYRFYPITDNVRQVDFFGGFTSAAGHSLYTARLYPKSYWNKTAFIAEPTGHLVATMDLAATGTDFIANYGGNLLASDDEWCAPIAADVGPDGCVWVSDWYNIVVQHNPTPNGFKTGARGAYETPLRDKVHGRIYRIVPVNSSIDRPIKLTANTTNEVLIQTLKNSNLLWRMHAQRLLVEKSDPTSAAKLVPLLQDTKLDAIGLNGGVFHALRVLEGLSQRSKLSADVMQTWYGALKHPSAAVRRSAALSLPPSTESVQKIIDAGLLLDLDPQVRLGALIALADMPRDDLSKGDQAAALKPTTSTGDVQTGEALVTSLFDPATLRDRWLPDALTSAASRNDLAFLQAVATKKFVSEKFDARALSVVERVAEHFARGDNVASLETLLVSLGVTNPQIASAIIGGLSKGLAEDRRPKLSTSLEDSLAKLFESSDNSGKLRVIALAQRWGSFRLNEPAQALAEELLTSAENDEAALPQRKQAVSDLSRIRRDDAKVATRLVNLLGPRTDPELVSTIVGALKASTADGLGEQLSGAALRLTPANRPLVLSSLLVRAEWTRALLKAFEDGALDIADLPLDQKQALSSHPNSEIAGRAKELLKRTGGLPDADRQSVVDRYAPLVQSGGNAQRGKTFFKAQCANCHMHSGEGKKFGPDLTGMAAHPKLELLTHILDPSRSVEGNFRTYTVLTIDGQVINGIMANETRTAIEILDAESKRHTLQRDEIDEIKTSRKSTMPEGFEKQLNPEAMTDLLEFLAARGKYFPLDLRKVASTVSTKDMFFEGDGQAERLIFGDWGPKTFEGVPFHLVDPDEGRVPNVVMLYGPNGKAPPKMPKSVKLPVSSPAEAIHLLSGISGWGFLGGTPSRSLTMIVRIHYQDGTTEDHKLLDGIHFADYINAQVNVPESKLAFRLRGQQVRYIKLQPQKKSSIEAIELVKGPDRTAPIVVAITIEGIGK